jgi:hypothetical protein
MTRRELTKLVRAALREWEPRLRTPADYDAAWNKPPGFWLHWREWVNMTHAFVTADWKAER